MRSVRQQGRLNQLPIRFPWRRHPQFNEWCIKTDWDSFTSSSAPVNNPSSNDSSGSPLGYERDARLRFAAAHLAMLDDFIPFFPGIDQPIVEVPRFQQRFGVLQGGIAGKSLLIEIAAVPDDREQRQTVIVQRVAQRISRFEQARALNHHEWLRPAEMQPGGNGPCLTFTADAHELDRIG